MGLLYLYLDGVMIRYIPATERRTNILFPIVRQTLVGLNLPIIEASPSDSDTPHTIRLLWTSDKPDAGNSAKQNPQNTDIYATGGIRSHNPNLEAAGEPPFRQQRHWDQQTVNRTAKNKIHSSVAFERNF
jgi:hypothetical protein